MTHDEKLKEKRAILRFLSAGGPQDSIKLRKGVTIFGREKADILINDKAVSSTHCQIQYIEGNYHVFDMNSSNGTFVNKQKIKRQQLSSGDVVTIGSTLFSFELSDEKAVKNVSSVMGHKKSQTDVKMNIAADLIKNQQTEKHLWGLELVIVYPDRQTQQMQISQNSILLGRGSSFADFEKDPQISRKHLIIKVNESGEVFAEDQGSTNGSFLNGNKIQGIHMVRPTDEVTIGGCTVKIRAFPRTP